MEQKKRIKTRIDETNAKLKIPSHCTNENSTTSQKRIKHEEKQFEQTNKKNLFFQKKWS